MWLAIVTVYGQDAHYWTEQFGNKSMLLGGNVIGSVDDLGATFYNPARLALQDDPSFLISAQAYQLITLGVKDGVQKADLNESSFGNAPTLAAGSFEVPFLPNHKFAYAFLSRQQVDYNLGTRSEMVYEFNDTWLGEETLYIDFNVNKTVKDDWMGGSWAYAISDRFSVGFSGFYSVFNQKRSYTLFQDGLSNDSSAVASFERTRIKKFSASSIVLKAAGNYETKNFSLGITVTSPYLVFKTSGGTEYDEVLSGFDFDEDGEYDDDGRLMKNTTSDVDVKYRTPFSIGIGSAYDFGPVKVHVSAEWFDKVSRYAVMVPAPFYAQKVPDYLLDGEEKLEVKDRLYDERNSVINWGVGLELSLVKRLKGFMSVASDYSTLDQPETGISGVVTDNFDNSVFTANIYHYGGGFMLNFNKIEVTLGTTYSRGTQSIGKIVNLPGDNSNPDERVDVLWERWRFLVGFSLPFYKFG
ncbi:Long-chain fatty acid transport protein [Reichenbachiella agariperforans]|uniref:Long-chain fatty acid transport protein n=2 Tax=Reichenbachiellaceae TaxID=2762302 RepID=A0A1M6P0E8_REIAG|nr:hypothetical protein BGP76_06005 [Reichenbachiella sp. MSK19-1]SHK01435.1 Long-chain fatty acid transport protein [Reichenbachiella agariperforans]